jgi:hypothetical protein
MPKRSDPGKVEIRHFRLLNSTFSTPSRTKFELFRFFPIAPPDHLSNTKEISALSLSAIAVVDSFFELPLFFYYTFETRRCAPSYVYKTPGGRFCYMAVLKRREVEEMRKPCTTGSLTRAASAFVLGAKNFYV